MPSWATLYGFLTFKYTMKKIIFTDDIHESELECVIQEGNIQIILQEFTTSTIGQIIIDTDTTLELIDHLVFLVDTINEMES